MPPTLRMKTTLYVCKTILGGNKKRIGSEGGYIVYAGNAIEKRSKNRMVLPLSELNKIQ